MGTTVHIHGRSERVLLLASNPATSTPTSWPVGFGNLVTGQQQYSGAAAARLVIETLAR